ncbi:MAG: T9SS type A sorting domain-containing protein [Bacteroidota bacterium]
MKRIFLSLILITLASSSWACSCFYDEEAGFCEFTEYADLIAIGKVVSKSNDASMKFEIDTYLKGTSSKKTITVTGNMCSMGTQNFEKGDRLVLSLTDWSSIAYNEADFTFLACAVTHLEVKGNRVVGKLGKGTKNMNLNAFMERMGRQECFGPTATLAARCSNEQIELISGMPISGNSQVSLYDLSGRLVHRIHADPIEAESSYLYFRKPELPAGLYVVEIRLGAAMNLRTKIIL